MLQDSANGVTVTLPAAPPIDGVQPDGSHVKDALLLAAVEAQRGDQPHAAQALKEASIELAKIGDPATQTYWQAQYDQTSAYVASLADNAGELSANAQLGDATYVRGQELTPDEIANLAADNADTARAMAAITAAGGDTTAGRTAYALGEVTTPGKQAIGNLVTAAGAAAGQAAMPAVEILIALAVLLVAGTFLYAFVSAKGAKLA